jgi:GDPmannose 4,6-dehydratase
MTTRSIITGITGQDGSYLAEYLLKKNHTVIGLKRRSSSSNISRIKHLLHNPLFILEEFDITDSSNCLKVLHKYRPQYFYNLAAQSHVGTSFSQPSTTFDINAVGVINILESIKHCCATTKFYQASTSEMFGSNYSLTENDTKYQDENTTFSPQSPYAIAKLAAHQTVKVYRNSYNLFCCSGILFNHESPRRGDNFVTRKITRYIGLLMNNKTNEKLKLGNIKAVRDWGHANDYIKAMTLMLDNTKPMDFVISTGNSYSVEAFLEKAFNLVNKNYLDHIIIDPSLYRPSEVEYLQGNSSLAQKTLGWIPKISFDSLVQEMVQHDIEYYKHHD